MLSHISSHNGLEAFGSSLQAAPLSALVHE